MERTGGRSREDAGEVFRDGRAGAFVYFFSRIRSWMPPCRWYLDRVTSPAVPPGGLFCNGCANRRERPICAMLSLGESARSCYDRDGKESAGLHLHAPVRVLRS